MQTRFFNYEALRLLVAAAITLRANTPKSEGGYFCWSNDPTSETKFLPQLKFVGNVPESSLLSRARNAFNKVLVLAQFPTYILSFNLRDVANFIYGGGIRYGNILCSFSGFIEAIDEAICLIFCAWGEFSNTNQITKPNEDARKFILEKAKEICPENEQIQPLLNKFIELACA